MAFLRLPRTVVSRLRFGVLLNGALVVAVVVFSLLGLHEILRVQATLNEEAVPNLLRFEAVREDLDALGDALGTLHAAGTRDTVAAARARALDAIASLRDTAGAQTDMAALVDDLRAGIETAADLKARHLALTATTDQKKQELIRLGLSAIDSIDALTAQTGADLEWQILSGEVDANASMLSSSVARFNVLTQFEGFAERNIDLLQSLDRAGTPIDIQRLGERLAYNLRSEIRSLQQLPDSPERTALANAIADMRDKVLGDEAILVLHVQRVETATRLRDAFDGVDSVISGVGQQVAANVSDARINMLDAAARSEEAALKARRAVALFSGLAFLAIAVIVLYLVEHQIIRRLNLLAASVRQIATGDTDHQVEVTGEDEFGEMAEALERFQANSRELLRSNSELSRFAYAASHDLRSPLRAIHDLAQWTLEDAGDDLSEDCRNNLEVLLTRVNRLSDLLGSLLEYACIGRESAAVSEVDLTDMANACLDLVGDGRDFTIEVHDGAGPVRTYGAPLNQIMLNLVTNAIKHHDRASGRLRVDSHVADGMLHVSVTDDGPGIPGEFHDRIFGLFQMLQSRDQVEGSGMGLAIIRKLTEQYGGKVTVISDPEERRGTTFAFTWPILADHQEDMPAMAA